MATSPAGHRDPHRELGWTSLRYAAGMIHAAIISCATLSVQPVQLDGGFEEWDTPAAAPSITGAGSASHIYLLMSLNGPPVNLQGLNNPMTLRLDWDNNPETGKMAGSLPGVDLEVLFSPSRGKGGSGVAVRRSSDRGAQSWDEVGFVFAPTVASNRFELCFPRTLRGLDLVAGSTMPWELSWTDPKPARGIARVGADRPMAKPTMSAPLPRPADGATRVVTWNLEKGNLLKQRRVVTRVLAAIKPHIVLIQEIEDGQTGEDFINVLRAAVPGSNWTIDLSPRSGTIKSGIATRLPAKSVRAFDTIKRRGESHGHVRAAALGIDIPGVGPVLAVSAHLKCCGVVDGPEDMKRIGEVLAIRRAAESAETERDFQGLIIGGDLNLVGGSLPLDLLIAQGEGLIAELDTPEDLLIIDAWQPDGRGLQTWQEDGQAYTPGRLDYIVISGSSLRPDPRTTVVLDTLDLPEPALRDMKLQQSDTKQASDHLPVIVDLMPAS